MSFRLNTGLEHLSVFEHLNIDLNINKCGHIMFANLDLRPWWQSYSHLHNNINTKLAYSCSFSIQKRQWLDYLWFSVSFKINCPNCIKFKHSKVPAHKTTLETNTQWSL